MTVHGHIYQYLGAMVAPDNLRSFSLSVYVNDADYIQQGNEREAQMPDIIAQLLQILMQILFKVNTHVRNFVAL